MSWTKSHQWKRIYVVRVELWKPWYSLNLVQITNQPPSSEHGRFYIKLINQQVREDSNPKVSTPSILVCSLNTVSLSCHWEVLLKWNATFYDYISNLKDVAVFPENNSCATRNKCDYLYWRLIVVSCMDCCINHACFQAKAHAEATLWASNILKIKPFWLRKDKFGSNFRSVLRNISEQCSKNVLTANFLMNAVLHLKLVRK